MSESWRSDLAMIRQRAAARCGLREYPAELIRINEESEKFVTPRRRAQLKRRRAELEAELKWIR